jgi:large conductance mechanosensitive channel
VLRGFGATSPVCFWLSLRANVLLISAVAFLGRDNVIEVALGLIIGAAFSTVVTSLVSDVILPPISLISPDARNLQSHFWVLRQGETPEAIYNTVEQAAADGMTTAVTHD